MTKLDVDFNRINLGHVLTIIGMIGTMAIFWAKFESRIAVLENNVQWLVGVTAKNYQVNPPASSK
jgi:hypothetical protein